MQNAWLRFWRRAPLCGARPAYAKATARQEFGGGGTPEAIPLSRDATGQEARAGPEGFRQGGTYGVNPDSINPSDLTTGQAKKLGQPNNIPTFYRMLECCNI